LEKGIIILGAPGSGKGTQADKLSREFNLLHLSTGELLRAEVKSETELGREVREILDEGKLVPDDLIMDIVKQRIIENNGFNGLILDGFPRNINQAKMLEEEVDIDITMVLHLNVSEDILKERILKRGVCLECGRIKIIEGEEVEICPECGGEVLARSDDSDMVLNRRFEIYESETSPLLEYYKNKGIAVEINGERQPEEIFMEIQGLIKDRNLI